MKKNTAASCDNKNSSFWKHPAFFYAVCAVLILLFIQSIARLAIVQGSSMEDTLRDGDIVLVWQWNYRPATGDIVVTNKNNPFGVRLTKRVVAVGGECYKAEDGSELWIPYGYVFLVGDNACQSRDSREIGPIPESDLLGMVAARVYPFDALCVFYQRGAGAIRSAHPQ